MASRKDLVRHELIGLRVKVLEAKILTLIGLQGKILDETQNTLLIRCKNSIKKLIKNQVKITVKVNKKEININGKDLVGRPHERIKK